MEEGSHKDLIREGKIYKRLYDMQFGNEQNKGEAR